jgi:hypothetical protein
MEYVAQTSRQVLEWLGGVYVNWHIYGGIKIPYMDARNRRDPDRDRRDGGNGRR